MFLYVVNVAFVFESPCGTHIVRTKLAIHFSKINKFLVTIAKIVRFVSSRKLSRLFQIINRQVFVTKFRRT